ncbi:hypothetical protein SAMN05444161_6142 [Rhizobiales bacterium GAS191]|nr:hypothetical protein SAMN05519103_05322 [Rhizobiales bacterium GAS113]SED97550.1 hypothetical protein SAMN05519104_4889 [Rhizobiales bacterium GAS188]SEE55169.1 hypothetical protein SAMN05444161_6142 [Rhizobiales bacterium GAS191]
MNRYCALALLLFVGSWPAQAGSPADQGFRKLTGPQIRMVLVGKTFTDETHFSNRYKADGTIDGFSMGKKILNTWRIVTDELCITNSFGELCYAVWKKGTDVQLVYKYSDITLYGSIK